MKDKYAERIWREANEAYDRTEKREDNYAAFDAAIAIISAALDERYRAGVEAMRRAWEDHEGDYHSPKLHAEQLLEEAEK